MTLTAASTLTSNNNAITFTSTINGGFALVINAGTSTVSFGGNVGQITGNFEDGVGSLTVTAGGGITLAAAATEMWTTGSQTYNSPVTLAAATKFASYRGTVTFASTLAAGANDLTIWADEIDFTGGNNSISGTGRLVLDNFNVVLSIIFNGTDRKSTRLNSSHYA